MRVATLLAVARKGVLICLDGILTIASEPLLNWRLKALLYDPCGALILRLQLRTYGKCLCAQYGPSLVFVNSQQLHAPTAVHTIFWSSEMLKGT